MGDEHIVIIGGGLAGLSTGCYGRMNGWRTTIVEHNLALGGVCTAWQRGPYTIDGCIHWLTGGAFMSIYGELGIIPPVKVRPLRHFATYRDVTDGREIVVGSDLEALARALAGWAPEDAEEIARVVAGAREVAEIAPALDHPAEIASFRERLGDLWKMRHQAGTLVHFRHTVGAWSREHIKNERLRRFFARLAPEEAPAFFLLMMLGYLGRGALSRPEGGTAAFRDALVDRYRSLGGEVLLHSTVEEILVEDERAYGVRLTDGTQVEGDLVVSTASAPETVLRLLGGRHGADDLRRRMANWKLFPPIVLVSFGVALPLTGYPPTLLLDRIGSFRVGGRDDETATVRIFNDEPTAAPPGHCVVQVMAETDYEFWAGAGWRYGAEKDALGEATLALLEPQLPGLRAAVKVTDVSTPLTFWRQARAWRGAFEGWMPSPDAFFTHVAKTLPGLAGFHMAGQWVEPGGGVPTALLSGRQLVQILCREIDRPFTSRVS